eukprot:CAMPEP_0202041712 /NCGR_PEP_ID=MMETSP0962-20130828/24905_1 /ASSEMBLY_ACC=CAM_ASM_000488 /TAXON_ID=4773 /ORGANISM="Schizochytrium aggregatum, Strain ATCC28209" /LENGTH=45 /DNA_ID= /DNA_START= /DNA_END= /DNA_ORIENTATION=
MIRPQTWPTVVQKLLVVLKVVRTVAVLLGNLAHLCQWVVSMRDSL